MYSNQSRRDYGNKKHGIYLVPTFLAQQESYLSPCKGKNTNHIGNALDCKKIVMPGNHSTKTRKQIAIRMDVNTERDKMIPLYI
jgi:hypothetical protein